jgi:F-type H+-transporting ATPase subunit delta
MNDSKIAVRYAKAIFLLAQEKNQLKEIAQDMELLLESEKKVPELKELYRNPVLTPKQKQDVLSNVFKNFNPISIQLVRLMTENRREEHFAGVARNYIKRFKALQGIIDATITTASILDKTQLETIKNIVKNTYKSEVLLKTDINNDLIGGFVLRVEDTQYDASIATQLKNIKQSLT